MSKPNVPLIHTDQLRYDCLGLNGHPFVETPNLDRLASQGANFRHAYAPAPICSPTRDAVVFSRLLILCRLPSGVGESRLAWEDPTPIVRRYLGDLCGPMARSTSTSSCMTK